MYSIPSAHKDSTPHVYNLKLATINIVYMYNSTCKCTPPPLGFLEMVNALELTTCNRYVVTVANQGWFDSKGQGT